MKKSYKYHQRNSQGKTKTYFPYEYYLSENNYVIAKGANVLFIFRDGWWEFVHGLIPRLVGMVNEELHHSYRLSEKELSNRGLRPISTDNQICRLPDPELLSHPLKKIINQIEKGSIINLYSEISQIKSIMHMRFSEFSADYDKALRLISEFIHAYEAASARAIEYVKREYEGEDFSDSKKVSKWIRSYMHTYEKQYDIEGLTILEIVDNDQNDGLRKALEILKKVHQCTMSRTKQDE